MPDRGEAAAEFRSGWRRLLGCMLGLAVGVHALPFGTSGLFLGPLTREFGWSRAQASLGPTMLFLCLGAVSPFLGGLIDRFGPRRVVLPGLVCLVAFFAALSRVSSLAAFYALFLAVGVLGAGSATPTYTRIVNARFRAARGRALGISLIGTGLSSAAVPPLLEAVISGGGWRAGYLALAAVVALATPAVVLLLGDARTEPSPADVREGAGFPDALRDPTLWLLAGLFLAVALAVGGFSGHFVALMTDQGVTAGRAARLMGAGGVFLIGGRLLTGFLIDRFFAPRVAAAVMVVSACGFLMIAQGGATFGILGLLAAGIAFGAEIDLVSYLVARYFGLRAYGRIYGVLYAFVVAGTALSPTLYGWCFDVWGSYRPVLQAAAGLLAAAAAGFLLLPPFSGRSARGSAIPEVVPPGRPA